MVNLKELEEIYLQAKESYYSGEPIMSDDEFDRFEEELIANGSTIIETVGAKDRNAKFPHPTPMLSLSKIQIRNDIPLSAVTSWMSKFSNRTFEVTPKFDGNAANAIYKNGKLVSVLSRGTGSAGREYIDKIKHNLPKTISILEDTEVRGEICIKHKTFDDKYSAFKNPRNFVAGVLNREDNIQETLNDLDFIPVEVRSQVNGKTFYHNLNDFLCGDWDGFTIPFYTYTAENVFVNTVELYTNYRLNESPYPLDGFVLKCEESERSIHGENSHDPNWAIAIKFPPKEMVTIIEKIVWHYGKTGELTPIAVMKPVDLDGSTVTRASLYNYGFVKRMKVYPGAQVVIAKSGDIIPQIQRVSIPAPESNFIHPTECKCGAELKIEGVHLWCISPTCYLKDYFRLQQGINHLGLDGVGGAMIKQIYDAGFISAVEILNPINFNKEVLLSKGFKNGKTLDNVFTELDKIKEISTVKVLLFLGIEGLGRTISKQVAKYLNGEEYSFFGLEKSVIAGFEEGGIKRKMYQDAVDKISCFRTVKHFVAEKILNLQGTYELTGSPKTAGFSKKEEFIKKAKEMGFSHDGLGKNTTYLITDDYDSPSSKMAKAKKLGVQIITYIDFIKLS
jgi:DNA ligase (NAD+)